MTVLFERIEGDMGRDLLVKSSINLSLERASLTSKISLLRSLFVWMGELVHFVSTLRALYAPVGPSLFTVAFCIEMMNELEYFI